MKAPSRLDGIRSHRPLLAAAFLVVSLAYAGLSLAMQAAR